MRDTEDSEPMGRAGRDRGWMTPVEFRAQSLPLGELDPPREPTVHLWYLDLGRLWAPLSSVLGHAPPGRAGEQESMSVVQLRFARRFYLRMLLGAYLGLAGKDVSLVRGPRGKPILDTTRHPGEIHFSLSKSGQRLLIGVSGGGEIGVDLELEDRKPRDAPELAKRFFTLCEAAPICKLEAAERDAAFMRTWACKEAVAKASGHGIANRFCRFSVDAAEGKPPRVREDQDHPVEGWQLALTTPEEGYIAALAVQQPSLRIEAFRI